MSLFSRLAQVQQNANDGREVAIAEAEGGAVSSSAEGNDINDLHPTSRSTAATLSERGNRSKNNATTPKDAKKSLKHIEAKAGVLLRTLKPGDATHWPKKGDTCTIHYEAFTEEEISRGNEEPFDSSRNRGQVFNFRLGAGQVIEGLDVAVSKMSVGQEVEATIPYPYAYGLAGYPPVVPPRATLIFRVELLQFSSVV